MIYILQYFVTYISNQSSMWGFPRLGFKKQRAKIRLSLFNSVLFAKEVNSVCNVIFCILFFKRMDAYILFEVISYITESCLYFHSIKMALRR